MTNRRLIPLFSVCHICRFSLTLIDTLDTLVVRTRFALKVVLVCMMMDPTQTCVLAGFKQTG